MNEVIGLIKDLLNSEKTPSANNIPSTEYSAIITGLTDKAREALFNRPLTVRYFPFTIGRISSSDPFLKNKLDLAIEDEEPYSVSKRHLSLILDQNKVAVKDEERRAESNR